jgi:phage shock protein A
MFELLSTLLKGSNAKAVEAATDHFAIDLLNQKIREAEAGVTGAKHALATLIVRQRAEQTALSVLRSRKSALEDRVRQAMAGGSNDLAIQGATSIAELENEETARVETVARLDEKVARLRHSVEKAHRRVIDLRQGAVTARAIDIERRSQRSLNRSLERGSAAEEAEALIRRIAGQDDPLEQAEIVEEIDHSLTHRTTEDLLAEAGFGPATKVRAEDVLARLRTTPAPTTQYSSP